MSVRLYHRIDGKAVSKKFDDLPPALDFAVRLVETLNGSVQELDLRRDGSIVFTRDEIVKASRQVRLS